MRFIDSARITVIAGNGGDGCVSFERKGKNSLLRKPNGSNGGNGGDVWLSVDTNISTLRYFNNNRIFKAGHGARGQSRNCTGKCGKDVVVRVPIGTRVRCEKSKNVIDDLNQCNKSRLMVAKGGCCGIGNRYFRSYSRIYKNKNIKNIMRCVTQGKKGESRNLILELFLTADVGVFGLPNSGKSSFVRSISRAKPKVSDYPFTTLVPNLGTVHMGDALDNRFVIADIPGIIQGASKGLGLGVQFLKHLKHCRILLHFVDVKPLDNSNIINNILAMERELNNYDADLMKKTRWLIFNKVDLLNKYELENQTQYIIQSLKWKERYYLISVAQNVNISLLIKDIMTFINKINFLKE